MSDAMRCPNCGKAVSIAEQIHERIHIPATPTELSALFEKPVTWIRSTLHQLKRTGRVKQLERGVPSQGKRGPKLERLWEAA